MKSYFNRAFALMISLIMIFSVASPAFAYECATHSFGNWKITKIATCEEKGEMERTCTKCGKVTEVNNIDLTDIITTNIKKFHSTHYSLHLYGLCNKCHQAIKRRKARMTKNKLQ